MAAVLDPMSNPESKESYDSPSRQSSGMDSQFTESKETPDSSTIAHQNSALVTFSEMPIWLQDNPFIVSGFRPVSHSAKACLHSWRYMHNESISIFTHLIPALLFLLAQAIVQPIFAARYPDASVGDRVVFAVFMITATICLGVSAGYHTLLNHSKYVSELSLRCDFVGIVVLIIGFFISGVLVGFHCNSKLRWIYWGMVCYPVSFELCDLSMLNLEFETDNSDFGFGNSNDNYPHPSSVSRTTLPEFSSYCLCWNGFHGFCPDNPWVCDLWMGCYDQAVGRAILLWRRSLACSWSRVLQCKLSSAQHRHRLRHKHPSPSIGVIYRGESWQNNTNVTRRASQRDTAQESLTSTVLLTRSVSSLSPDILVLDFFMRTEKGISENWSWHEHSPRPCRLGCDPTSHWNLIGVQLQLPLPQMRSRSLKDGRTASHTASWWVSSKNKRSSGIPFCNDGRQKRDHTYLEQKMMASIVVSNTSPFSIPRSVVFERLAAGTRWS